MVAQPGPTRGHHRIDQRPHSQRRHGSATAHAGAQLLQESPAKISGQIMVTMEHPSKDKPQKLVIEIDQFGARPVKRTLGCRSRHHKPTGAACGLTCSPSSNQANP